MRSTLAATNERQLQLHHLHTGEQITVSYWRGGAYDHRALQALDRNLRDWRQNEVHEIDPTLFDLTFALARALGEQPRYEILCGYRSKVTNEMLRRRSRGVAKHSLHLVGQAIDLRLPGVPLATLRNAAIDLQAGGVGFYPVSNFVHVDTGRVRQWGS